MLIKNILKFTLLLLALVYISLDVFGYYFEAETVRLSTLVLLCILYYQFTVHKSMLFLWFLIADIIGYLFFYCQWFDGIVHVTNNTYLNYFSTGIYIISYSLLILYIISKLNFKHVFKHLFLPVLILLALDVFCITLLSDISVDESYSTYNVIQEYMYYTVVMVLLSVALINYMYRSDKKSMLILIGCICFFFMEIVVAALYFTQKSINLEFLSTSLTIIAYALIYLQSQIEYTGPEPDIIELYQ